MTSTLLHPKSFTRTILPSRLTVLKLPVPPSGKVPYSWPRMRPPERRRRGRSRPRRDRPVSASLDAPCLPPHSDRPNRVGLLIGRSRREVEWATVGAGGPCAAIPEGRLASVHVTMSGEAVRSSSETVNEGLDQREAPYLDAIVAYAARNPGRFHVPGHKGGEGGDPELVDALGEAAFEHDIPAGIEGVDVGPDSPFQRGQRLAADAWGARRSWFLISGASQGNHAACLALRHAGSKVVAQRNVHSSTVDGIVLAGLEPAFVAPELDAELG